MCILNRSNIRDLFLMYLRLLGLSEEIARSERLQSAVTLAAMAVIFPNLCGVLIWSVFSTAQVQLNRMFVGSILIFLGTIVVTVLNVGFRNGRSDLPNRVSVNLNIASFCLAVTYFCLLVAHTLLPHGDNESVRILLVIPLLLVYIPIYVYKTHFIRRRKCTLVITLYLTQIAFALWCV